MEYEIEDETRLFDDSTNPSLKRTRATARTMSPLERRKLQKAELIPEEEDQAA